MTESELLIMIKKYRLPIFLLFITVRSFSQSTYAPLNKDYYHLLDRYEIKQGSFSTTFHTAIKPIERKSIVGFIDSLKIDSTKLSRADRFNLRYLVNDNWEWSANGGDSSKKSILKTFYKKPAELYSLNTKDAMIAVRPVINFQVGNESATSDMLYVNTRGIEVRGMINKKVGFYTYLADNQALFPQYVRTFVSTNNAVPGEGFYKVFKTNGSDFLTGRGYINFNISKNIGFQFGHDKNFFGDGYRSLVLSDF